MSDLINREDVIKCLQENGWLDDTNIDELIETIPTAYSVDKVVEELEQLADESYKAFCIAFNSDDRAEYDAYTNAIEIVKQGGVRKEVE